MPIHCFASKTTTKKKKRVVLFDQYTDRCLILRIAYRPVLYFCNAYLIIESKQRETDGDDVYLPVIETHF